MSLNVQFGPKFIAGNLNLINSTLGSNASLSCSAASNPPANSINWYFTSKGSNDTILINDENQEFIKIEMNEKNEGSYECDVKNIIGKARKQIILSLVPKGEH